MTDIPDRYIDLSLELTGTEGWTCAVVRYAAEAENQHGLHDEARAILAHARTLMERDAERQEVSDKMQQTMTYLDQVFCQSGHKSARHLIGSLIIPPPVDPDEELAREIAREIAPNGGHDEGIAYRTALAAIKRSKQMGD